MILYINSCVRGEVSRTDRLARYLLRRLGNYTEVKLDELSLKPMTKARLEKRTALLQEGKTDDPMFDLAHQWASADTIVIGAPFWDLSFPSELKLYIENIYATGIVAEYGPDGRPRGLCKAKTLYFVTTAGGPLDPRFGYEYIREMALHYFGIGDTRLIAADMLDVIGFDTEEILRKTEQIIDADFEKTRNSDANIDSDFGAECGTDWQSEDGKYRIRTIRPSDNTAMAELIRSNLKAKGLDIPGTAYFDEQLNQLSEFYLEEPSKRHYFILTDDQDQVLGGVGLAECSFFDDCMEVQKLYVSDTVKGLGLGEKLLAMDEQKAEELGYKRFYLETHTNLDAALGLYEKSGYREIAKPECVIHSTMNKFFMKDL